MSGITLVGAALRLYQIGAKTLWWDEIFSIWIARHDLSDLVRWTWLIDFHPPFYYTLLHYWLALGSSEAIIRLLSAILGTITIPVLYAIGSTLGGHRIGSLAAILLAFSPFHVRYGQEARMYTLLTFAAGLAIWGLAVLIRSAEPNARPGVVHDRKTPGSLAHGGKRRPLAWAAYVGGAAVALLSHNLAVLLLLATNVVALVWWWGRRAQARGFLRNWVLAQLAVLVVVGAWLPFALDQASTASQRPWDLPHRLGDFLYTLQTLYGPTFHRFALPTRLTSPSSNVILLILLGLGLWGWRRQQQWIILLLGLWLVGLISGLFIVILTVGNLGDFMARTLIWTSIPVYLLIASGIARLRGKIAAVVLLGFLATNVYAIESYYVYSQKSWAKEMVAYVATHAKPGDAVVFYLNAGQLQFDYYYPRYDGPPVVRHGIPSDFPARPLTRLLWLPGPVMPEESIRKLESFVSSYDRVWLVYSWTDPGYLPFPLDRVEGLSRREVLKQHQIFLFEREPGENTT